MNREGSSGQWVVEPLVNHFYVKLSYIKLFLCGFLKNNLLISLIFNKFECYISRLLSECTVSSCTEGSNPSLSAISNT